MFCSPMRQSISITVYLGSENLKVIMVAHVNLEHVCAWRAIASEAFVGPFFFTKQSLKDLISVFERLAKWIELHGKRTKLH